MGAPGGSEEQWRHQTRYMYHTYISWWWWAGQLSYKPNIGHVVGWTIHNQSHRDFLQFFMLCRKNQGVKLAYCTLLLKDRKQVHIWYQCDLLPCLCAGVSFQSVEESLRPPCRLCATWLTHAQDVRTTSMSHTSVPEERVCVWNWVNFNSSFILTMQLFPHCVRWLTTSLWHCVAS